MTGQGQGPKFQIGTVVGPTQIGDQNLQINREVDAATTQLALAFAAALEQVRQLPADEREDVQPLVEKAAQDAQALAENPADQERAATLKGRLQRLGKLAPAIGKMLLEALLRAGMNAAVQGIAGEVLHSGG